MCVSSYVPLKGACICVLASACVLSCLVLRVYSHVRACVCIYIYISVCVCSPFACASLHVGSHMCFSCVFFICSVFVML